MDVQPGSYLGRFSLGDGLHEVLQDCVARGWEVVVEQRPNMVRLLAEGSAPGESWQAWFDAITHRLALARWTFGGLLSEELRVARKMLGSAGQAVTGSDVDARLGAAWPTEAPGAPGLWVSSFEGMSLGFLPLEGRELPDDRSRLRLRHVWVYAKGASPLAPRVPRMPQLGSALEDRRAGGAASARMPEAASRWLEARLGPAHAASATAWSERQAQSGQRGLCAVLGPPGDAWPWAAIWLPGRGEHAWLVASGEAGSSEDDVLAALGRPSAQAAVRPLVSSLAVRGGGGAPRPAAGSPGSPGAEGASLSGRSYRACCWAEREGVDLLLCPVRRVLLGLALTMDEPGHRDFGAVARASFAAYVVGGEACRPGRGSVVASPPGEEALRTARAAAPSKGAAEAEGKGSPDPVAEVMAADVPPRASAPEAEQSESDSGSESEPEGDSRSSGASPRGSGPEGALGLESPAAARDEAEAATGDPGAVGRAVSGTDGASSLTSESLLDDWKAALGPTLRPVYVPPPRGAVTDAGPDRDGLTAATFGATEALLWERGVAVEYTSKGRVARVTVCVAPPEQ